MNLVRQARPGSFGIAPPKSVLLLSKSSVCKPPVYIHSANITIIYYINNKSGRKIRPLLVHSDLVSFEDVPGVNFIGDIVQNRVVSVGDDSVRLCLESMEVIHHL